MKSVHETAVAFLTISDYTPVRERVILSALFMLLLGQIEVMKIRAGWPPGGEMDMFTMTVSITFYLAVWGQLRGSFKSFVMYLAGVILWGVISNVVRVVMYLVMNVWLFPDQQPVVLP